MVPSAHYMVDALGRGGNKSHNLILSQWGQVSTGGQGEHISLMDGYCVLNRYVLLGSRQL